METFIYYFYLFFSVFFFFFFLLLLFKYIYLLLFFLKTKHFFFQNKVYITSVSENVYYISFLSFATRCFEKYAKLSKLAIIN